MGRSRIQQGLTGALVCCLALIAAIYASRIAAFSTIRISLPASGGKDVTAIRSAIEKWVDVPGAAISARSLRVPASGRRPGNVNPSRDIEDLKSVLALRPMSSPHWLALAEALIVAKAPASQINTAMTMSHITGPREGYVMMARGTVALETWQTLTVSLKQKAARDIALTWKHLSHPQLARIILMLATSSEDKRTEVRRLLETVPEMNDVGLRRLGFTLVQ